MKINKYDIILIISIIVISVFVLYNNNKNLLRLGSNVAKIYSNGELIEQYDLDSNYQKEFTIENGDNYNTLEIRDGQVYIKDANCKDKLCVHQGKIHKDGELIVCIPNRLIVKIEGNNQNESDIDNIDIITK